MDIISANFKVRDVTDKVLHVAAIQSRRGKMYFYVARFDKRYGWEPASSFYWHND